MISFERLKDTKTNV